MWLYARWYTIHDGPHPSEKITLLFMLKSNIKSLKRVTSHCKCNLYLTVEKHRTLILLNGAPHTIYKLVHSRTRLFFNFLLAYWDNSVAWMYLRKRKILPYSMAYWIQNCLIYIVPRKRTLGGIYYLLTNCRRHTVRT